MNDLKKLFQYMSYLQYPCMLIGIFYIYMPLLYDKTLLWDGLNKALIFMGLATSFSTLQDTKKTQNKLSKRVWENPTYAKIFLIYLLLLIIGIILFGMYGVFVSKNTRITELSFGVIIFGMGLIGFLKTAIEMAEHHSNKNE